MAGPSLISVHLAREQDLPEIAALAAIIWRAHYPGIISHAQIDYMLSRMYDLEVIRQEIRAGTIYLSAKVDGAMRGFAAFGPRSGAETKLHKLYVHPQWQRHGIGSALLTRVHEMARSQGATTLLLNVNKRNDKALAAYNHHGFTVREAVTVDIGSGFVMDDFIMEKRL